VSAGRVERGSVAWNGSAAAAPADGADFLWRLGQVVRTVRLLRKVSQEELARAAGVSRNFVSSLERGEHACDVRRLWLVSLALNAPLSVLFGAVPAVSPSPASAKKLAAQILRQLRRPPEVGDVYAIPQSVAGP
jgi:transcriptional regulator with XRE-family HTH domain